jgi:hypothetical protein
MGSRGDGNGWAPCSRSRLARLCRTLGASGRALADAGPCRTVGAARARPAPNHTGGVRLTGLKAGELYDVAIAAVN